MLEEALRNEKSMPSEIALALLSFLREELPAGGTAAESRFIGFFGILCERIFGEIDSVTFRHHNDGWMCSISPWPRPSIVASSSSSTHRQSQSRSQTHASPMNVPGISTIQQHNPLHHHPNPTSPAALEAEPVVELLGGSSRIGMERLPTLLDALTQESEQRPGVGFGLKFHALPKAIQNAWLALLEASFQEGVSGGGRTTTLYPSLPQNYYTYFYLGDGILPITENDRLLLGHLLHKPPKEQFPLMSYFQQQQQQRARADPFGFQNQQQQYHYHPPPGSAPPLPPPQPLPLAAATRPSYLNMHQSPTASHQSLSSPTKMMIGETNLSSNTRIQQQQQPPNVLLTMLEYYLFLYFRFPLATPEPSSTRSGSTTYRYMGEPYGDAVYFYLFRKYLRFFLPYSTDASETADRTTSATIDPTILLPSSRVSELFLRTMIAFWMESRTRTIPTDTLLQVIYQRRQKFTARGGGGYASPSHLSSTGGMEEVLNAMHVDLDQSYELVQSAHNSKKYLPLPGMVHRCLRSLVVHSLLDSTITRNIEMKCDWCLSKPLTILQQPMYNYLRTTLRYASIHSETTSSGFFAALNIWLLLLEPWNIIVSRKTDLLSAQNAKRRILDTMSGGATSADDNVKSSFSPSSPRPGNSNVTRSLRIPRANEPSKYRPEWEPYIAANLHLYVVPLAIFLRRARELDFSAAKFERSMDIVKRVFRVFAPDVIHVISRLLDPSLLSSSELRHVVQKHVTLLGPFAPPSTPLSLSSLKSDMQSLLEEIDMQHVKKVRELDFFDRLIGRVEGWFGTGVVTGEEKKLESLMERAKLIAQVPLEFEFIPRYDNGSGKDGIKNVPLRDQDGNLSEIVRQQIINGEIQKCDPSTVPYIGDIMRARVSSYEISFLVTLAIWASDEINNRLGFSGKPGTFRVNLRWIADYRNLGFFVMMSYILLKILF